MTSLKAAKFNSNTDSIILQLLIEPNLLASIDISPKAVPRAISKGLHSSTWYGWDDTNVEPLDYSPTLNLRFYH
ncbi:hypothetical protein TNCT_602301 [Trichonephila clavata]|uniref:Uncharacterized protein n=1 Tax=Trichonephila clavata TaxID=2740835 RepID=A0A8X6FKF0_TRICU|nr:hypothetical protein TNCT_175971 [Trichonephila clavata]GFQ84749.1 hypothetical protein TNCT_602301 [Trichonephila clavata]